VEPHLQADSFKNSTPVKGCKHVGIASSEIPNDFRFEFDSVNRLLVKDAPLT
jgi:hypothetical protein